MKSICACCGKPRTRRTDGRGWNGSHGRCSACAERWRLAGRPADGAPPPPGRAERAARISAGLARHHAAHGQSQAALSALAAGRAARLAAPRPGRPAVTREQWNAAIGAGMRAWHASGRCHCATAAQDAADRLQDYAWLVSFGESTQQAARRVGITPGTARAYDRRLASEKQDRRAA